MKEKLKSILYSLLSVAFVFGLMPAAPAMAEEADASSPQGVSEDTSGGSGYAQDYDAAATQASSATSSQDSSALSTLDATDATEVEAQLTYTVRSKKATVKGVSNADTATVANVPAEYDGNPVTSIGGKAFAGCAALTTVNLPSSITNIAYGAFRDCPSLTSIEIPDGVTSINTWTFSGDSSLAKVKIPDSVTKIDSTAFEGCPQTMVIDCNEGSYAAKFAAASGFSTPFMTSETSDFKFVLQKDGTIYVSGVRDGATPTDVTLPTTFNGLTVTGTSGSALADCTSLTSVVVPDSYTAVGNLTFSGCTSLKSVVLPSNLTNLGSSMFNNCSSLESVTLPYFLVTIQDSAFSGTSALKSIELPSSVVSMGNNAFAGSGITSITLPSGVTNVAKGAFSGCQNLETITLSDSTTTIMSDAFANDAALTSIKIPATVTSIASDAFTGCTNLTMDVTENAYAKTYAAVHGIRTTTDANDQATQLLFELDADGNAQVVGVSDKSATSIEIPAEYNGLKVTSIAKGAFDGCTQLASVTIPDSITSIGDGAFEGCTSLDNVVIPDSVTSIGSRMFGNCTSLTNVKLPSAITTLPSRLFYNCTSLKSFDIPEGITGTVPSIFEGCTSLTSATIPEGVTTLDNTFKGCTALTGVELPSSVTTLKATFDGCTALTHFEIPSTVTTLESTFSGSGLTSASIPSTVTSVSGGVFSKCANLEVVGLPTTMTSVPNAFFSGCTSLKYVSLPNTVTSIGSMAFNKCTSLEKIIIPDSVTTISGMAFEGCSALKLAVIPDSVTVFGTSRRTSNVFSGTSADFKIACNDTSAAKTFADKYSIPTISLEEADTNMVVPAGQYVAGATTQSGDLKITDVVVNSDGTSQTANITVENEGVDAMFVGTAADAQNAASTIASSSITNSKGQSVAGFSIPVASLDAPMALAWHDASGWHDSTVTFTSAGIAPYTGDAEMAKAVEDSIAALPDPNDVLYSDRAAVAAARSSYDSLTDAQKALVSNADKLAACEAVANQAVNNTTTVDWGNYAATFTVSGKDGVAVESGSVSISEGTQLATAHVTFSGADYSQVIVGGRTISPANGVFSFPVVVNGGTPVVGVNADGSQDSLELTTTIPEGMEPTFDPIDNTITLPNGEYVPENSDSILVSGGTGKVKLSCPKVTVENGRAYAYVRFSSESYSKLRSAGPTYEADHSDGGSTFKIPVKLNQDFKVTGLTTAMSAPHWIDYNIRINLTEPQLSDQAKAVVDQINALPSTDSLEASDIEKVQSAREAYDALTDDQKAEVNNLAVLESLENAIKDATPAITTTSLPDGFVDTYYEETVEATGNPAPTFAATGLPDGITIDPATGVISGTTTAGGAYQVTVTAQNSMGSTSQTFELAVNEKAHITTTSLPAAEKGKPYEATIDATGYPNPEVEQITNLPEGLTYDKYSRKIYGTPTQSGTFTLHIIVGTTGGVDSTNLRLIVTSNSEWTRLSGETRYGTMQAIASEGWSGKSVRIILASGENFPDALSASALSSVMEAPVILTSSDSLSPEAASEIERIAIGDHGAGVIVLGGEAAIPESVVNQVKQISNVADVKRVSGETRIETGLAVYQEGHGSWGDTAIVASVDGYADALSIGPFAAYNRAPIFGARNGVITDEEVQAIKDGGFTKIVVMGGDASVNFDALKAQLGDGLQYTRLAGQTRYETSAETVTWETTGVGDEATFAPNRLLIYDGMAVAGGENFPDALSSINVLGNEGSVLLLVDETYPWNAEITKANIDSLVAANKGSIYHGYVLGGQVAVPDSLMAELEAATE